MEQLRILQVRTLMRALQHLDQLFCRLIYKQHQIEGLMILGLMNFVELPKSRKSWDGKSPLVHPPGLRP